MAKNYKQAKIYKGSKGDPKEKWFVYYSFIHPVTLKFQRFKVYEEINSFKDLKEKEEYANELCKQVNRHLREGYSPFNVEELTEELIYQVEEAKKQEEAERKPSIIKAFQEFIKEKNEKELEPDTITTYTSYQTKFEHYLNEYGLSDTPINEVDNKFVKDMLYWLADKHEWNGTTYNNHLAFWVTMINWFAKKPRKWLIREDFDIGEDEYLSPKKARPMKHQYFGDNVRGQVLKKIKDMPALEFYLKFIYYSCMRPDEIRELKIENVDTKGRYIKIVGKTDSRTVPICDELAEMLKTLNLERFPLSYYVIGKLGEVSEQKHSENYFSKMFREEVRKPLGLSANFTPYGWKHTRVVDLLNAGYSDAEVMNLTGHITTASYDKYKRELVGHLKTRLRGKTVGW